jgi:hypothetical protein
MGKRILAYCHKRRQLAVGSVAFVDRAMTEYGAPPMFSVMWWRACLGGSLKKK